VKTEPLDLPSSSAHPVELARALRSLVERLSQHSRDQIERYEGMPGPPELERALADCEAFIRETSAVSSLGLDYEGGRELAEAKRTRSELRREREELLRPYRQAAEAWRAIRARLAPVLRRPRGLDQDPERLRALLALLADLRTLLPDSDLQTLRAARAQLKRLATGRPPAGRGSDGAAAAVSTTQGPGPRAGSPGAPGRDGRTREAESSEATRADGPGPRGADPDPELLSRYLPPPGV